MKLIDAVKLVGLLIAFSGCAVMRASGIEHFSGSTPARYRLANGTEVDCKFVISEAGGSGFDFSGCADGKEYLSQTNFTKV